MVTCDSPAHPFARCVLFDCAGQTVAAIRGWILEFRAAHANPRIGLLNVDPGSRLEELVELPEVVGVFPRETSRENFSAGVEILLLGGYWLPRPLLHRFLERHRKGSAESAAMGGRPQHTPREIEILRCLRDGMSNAQIAEQLSVSESTIKSHLYRIYRKSGFRNRLEACAWAQASLER